MAECQSYVGIFGCRALGRGEGLIGAAVIVGFLGVPQGLYAEYLFARVLTRPHNRLSSLNFIPKKRLPCTIGDSRLAMSARRPLGQGVHEPLGRFGMATC